VALGPSLSWAVVDRVILIMLFGTHFISTDDAVIWHATMDFAHGLFRGPYYYGQDYSPMLEALVAAPFYKIGLPMNVLMPTVSSLLAMLPYWSFALWFQRKGWSSSALVLAAFPLLMPVEFGAMTTMSRGFVTGIALLALFPWLAEIKGPRLRSWSLGAICSMAWS
jgi:hypothetical protein